MAWVWLVCSRHSVAEWTGILYIYCAKRQFPRCVYMHVSGTGVCVCVCVFLCLSVGSGGSSPDSDLGGQLFYVCVCLPAYLSVRDSGKQSDPKGPGAPTGPSIGDLSTTGYRGPEHMWMDLGTPGQLWCRVWAGSASWCPATYPKQRLGCPDVLTSDPCSSPGC